MLRGQRAHRLANRDRINKTKREDERRRRYETKRAVLALHGPGGLMQCSEPGCLVTDPDMLTLDHINDDGRIDRNNNRGDKIYRTLRRSGARLDLQTLCANHNLKKDLLRRRAAWRD